MGKLVAIKPRLDEVRRIMAENATWSPRDFIPGISRAEDRAIRAESLTRGLRAEDDLRFFYESRRHGPLALLAERLAWDSDFFGLGVARLNAVFPLEAPFVRLDAVWNKPLEKLLKQAQRRGVRYLFAMVDPRDTALLRSLGELGFALIETRYYHHGPLTEPPEGERFPVREARPEDVPSLARTAAEQVNPYDRFHADPFMQGEDTGRLMRRWIEESIAGRMADLVLVPDVEEPTAFVTYRFEKANWARWGVNLAQGVLSAVSADFLGWMGKLTPELNRALLAAGANYTFGSTQVTNRPIIHFAQEAGARFGRCEHILRVLL